MEVDVRSRDQLAIEHDREVLEGAARVAAEEVVLAALSDLARRLLPDCLALVGEAEVDGRRAAAASAVGKALLRVGDVGAAEGRVVLQHVVLIGALALGWAFGLNDNRSRLHSDDRRVSALRNFLRCDLGVEIGLRLLGAGQNSLRLVVDEVVGAGRRLLASIRLRAARRALYRRVLRHCAGAASCRRSARHGRICRGRLAARSEDVGLPVVEVELSRLPDLRRGLIGVGDVR